MVYVYVAGKDVLPFEPLSIVFQDVQYYVESPNVRESDTPSNYI